MPKEKDDSSSLGSVLKTVSAGLDLTTRHWWLLIVPLLLDCFFWVGPRLSLAELAQPVINGVIAEYQQLPGSQVVISPEEVFPELVERNNLLTQLSLPFIGVPALMRGLTPLATPIEPLAHVEVQDWASVVINIVVLSTLGVFLSAIYYSMIAYVVREETIDWFGFGRNLIPSTIRMIFLAILIAITLFIISIPILIVATLAMLAHSALATLALIGGSVFIMWTLIYLSFSVQSLLLEDVGIFRACINSMRLVQGKIPLTLPLLLIVVLGQQLTDGLWLSADNGSWLTFISLVGHAFIATSFVAATFIFYRDHAGLGSAPTALQSQ